MDYAKGVFICEDCGAELVDNEDAESVRGNQDRMQRFNRQMSFIREGLRKSEAMVLPAFDVALWVKNNSTDADRQGAAQSSGLKVAGSGPGSGKVDDGIGVVMSMDKDEATRRQEREAEAEAKRQQNALPEWIRKSTVSGHLTASGVAESVRAENAARPSSSNDEILRGLGTVGPAKIEESIVSAVEDVKPLVEQDQIDYDRYYASLAASATASTNGTPSGLGFPGGDDFGASDDEEDRKPSIEYLQSLNDYRKRSRSREDIGTPKTKVARLTDNSGGKANGHVTVPIVVEPQQPDVADEGTLLDDPVVYVNGVPKAFSEVTEDDHGLMTPEEYTAYFEVFEARASY